MTITSVLRSARLPFLVLTPACVFLGASFAIADKAGVDVRLASLVLLGALLAHISVNMLNEYHDFKSGLDLATVKTPFSGGSGALPENPAMAGAVLKLGLLSLLACILIGLYFFRLYGASILPIGIAGVLLIVSYTGWINRHPLLCLVAPGAGFGLLMVTGTHFVVEGEYTLSSLLASGVAFFLVNNLLLLNQYPDISADANVGRRTFPIVFGVRNANIVYALFALAAALLIVASVLNGIFPMLGLVALLPMPLAMFALRGAMLHGDRLGQYPQYMAANVAVAVVTPLLLGAANVFADRL